MRKLFFLFLLIVTIFFVCKAPPIEGMPAVEPDQAVDSDSLKLSSDDTGLYSPYQSNMRVRKLFERYLEEINVLSTQESPPTCFICFNFEEEDIRNWLEDVFIPDLQKAGIKPLFSRFTIRPGKELNAFQGLAREADQVIVICTPELKQKYLQRQTSPIGLAQEIRLCQERYNDSDKYETIYPLYLKGSRRESCPSHFFEPIFGIKFNGDNYYENAYELFSAQRNIPLEITRKKKKAFISQLRNILHPNHVNKMPCLKQFVGRKQELMTLTRLCKSERCVAVCGLGGIGKSTMAAKFAEASQEDFDTIAFIKADSRQSLVQQLLQLADELSIPEGSVDKRLQLLKLQFEKKNFLLIFDGVDCQESFNALKKHIPEEGNSLVLITSRMPEHSLLLGAKVVELGPLASDEAVQLLDPLAYERKYAEQLVEKLGGLPLALRHTTAYMRARNISIEKYLDRFGEYQLELFEERYLNLQHDEKTVLTTWLANTEQIRKQCPLSEEVMGLMALTGPVSVPIEVLEEWCRAYHADVSTLELENVLRYLREYSLIDGSQENFYHVHPLVQQMTLYYLDKKNPSCKQELTSQLLNTLFTLTKKYRAKTPETYHFTGSLIPLCTHYFKQEGRWNHPMEALALLLVKTNYHIDVEKNYSEAENCLALANEIAGDLDLPLKGRVGFLNGFVDYVKAKECSDPSVRTALFGSAHQHFQRALEIYDQYIDEELYLHIESNSKKCNRNHQKAICLEYQAQLLIELDRLDEAKQALENSLRELLAICPSGKHYDIARILREEGIILMKRENYSEALEKIVQALKMQQSEEVYGSSFDSHPTVAATYIALGDLYEKMQAKDKAYAAFEKALSINSRIYGETHPFVLRAKQRLLKLS